MFVKNRVAENLVAKFDFVENSAIRTLVFTTGQINTQLKQPSFSTSFTLCDEVRKMRPNRNVSTKKAGTAKLPRFCFVTVYFQVFCFVGRRRLRFPLREIPTVASFPRNDRLYGRERRLIRIDVIKPNVHPYRLVMESVCVALL